MPAPAPAADADATGDAAPDDGSESAGGALGWRVPRRCRRPDGARGAGAGAGTTLGAALTVFSMRATEKGPRGCLLVMNCTHARSCRGKGKRK